MPGAEFDHAFHRGLNRPEHGWVICRMCHAELTHGGYLARFSRMVEFRGFQTLVLEQWRRARPGNVNFPRGEHTASRDLTPRSRGFSRFRLRAVLTCVQSALRSSLLSGCCRNVFQRRLLWSGSLLFGVSSAGGQIVTWPPRA